MTTFAAGGFGSDRLRDRSFLIITAVGAALTACGVACQPQPVVLPPAVATERPLPSENRTVVATVPVSIPEADLQHDDTPSESSPPVELDVTGSGDWPVFHSDAARTGASSAPALSTPRLRWKARVGIQSWLNSPIVVGSVVIAPSCGTTHDSSDPDDGVYAIDLVTGRTAWRASLPNDANGAAATKDRVFVTSDDGQLRALSLKTGAELWKRSGQGKMYSHPLIAGERVVVGDASGHLRAFAFDGRAVFDIALKGPIRGGASADARAIYATSQAGDVVAVTPDGRILWQIQVDHAPRDGKGPLEPAEVYSPPLVARDAIIVPFARDTYYKDAPAFAAFDKLTGKLAWRARGPGDFGNVRSTPALVAGALVYAEPYSGDILAVSASTGRVLYRRSVGLCYFPQWSSPAAAGDVAYVLRFDGVLHAIRASDGKTVWSYYLGDVRRAGTVIPQELAPNGSCEWEVPTGHAAYSPVAIARDGTILAGTSEGYLYALEETR